MYSIINENHGTFWCGFSEEKKKLDIQTKLLRSLCSIVNTKIKFGSNEKKIKKRKNIIVQKKTER